VIDRDSVLHKLIVDMDMHPRVKRCFVENGHRAMFSNIKEYKDFLDVEPKDLKLIPGLGSAGLSEFIGSLALKGVNYRQRWARDLYGYRTFEGYNSHTKNFHLTQKYEDSLGKQLSDISKLCRRQDRVLRVTEKQLMNMLSQVRKAIAQCDAALGEFQNTEANTESGQELESRPVI